MRTTTVRPKPMPRRRGGRESLWSALAWLVFCIAMVAVGIFLTPKIGAAYAAADQTIPSAVNTSGTTLVSDIVDSAVPMAATVLYPNERLDTPAAASTP